LLALVRTRSKNNRYLTRSNRRCRGHVYDLEAADLGYLDLGYLDLGYLDLGYLL
jgi:hypothetical protein